MLTLCYGKHDLRVIRYICYKIRYMKILSLVIALIINPGNWSENPSDTKNNGQVLSGKIIESGSGEVLTGVEIEIIGSGEKYYSDFDGEFEITGLDPSKEIYLRITYISYKNKIIKGLNPGNRDLIIKLQNDEPAFSPSRTVINSNV